MQYNWIFTLRVNNKCQRVKFCKVMKVDTQPDTEIVSDYFDAYQERLNAES
jgi:hypothetical protein